MNPLALLRDILVQFSIAPTWAQLLTKATLLLVVAWVVHFSLARANPRWRTLLWRGVAVGLLLVVRLATGCAGLRRLLRTSQVVSDELVAEVGRIGAALGCRHAVQVRSSRQIAVPFMCGLQRPVLVLPERMCLPDYRRHLPGVIAHELAHVLSSDFAWNAAVQPAAILLWFHPLAWRIGSAHRAACDAVCDAVAASHLGDAAAYCRTLAQVAIQGAASFPALGLAMARTCDVRRRIAAIQRRVSAAALGRRAVFGVILAGSLASALLAGVRVAVAEPPARTTEGQSAASPAKEAGDNQPVKPEKLRTVSMSAEAFGRLSAAEQRALLVRIYRRRLEQSQNLFYEVDVTWRYYEDDHGHPGKPRKLSASDRHQYRHWLLGDSFRTDHDGFANIGDAEPSRCSSYAQNAVEGVARLTGIDKTGKTPPSGEIQYPNLSDDGGDDYIYWFDHRGRKPSSYLGEYLFPYLIGHQDQFEIKAPIADGKVQLTVPWQPLWAEKPGGKRVYVLDPQKGFLPIRCDSRWDDVTLRRGEPLWRVERLAVQESRLVGDVWLPTKLTNEVATPSIHKLHTVCELKVLRIEPAVVKLDDFFLPFTAGMQVRDTIEGVTYVADAQGNAVNPKFDPNWKSQPPEGWSKRASSMFSRFSPADRLKLDAEKKSLDDKNAGKRRAFEAALKVMRSPAPLDERVEAGLNVLRTSPTEIDRDFKPWASVIRELIEIGKPAVPKLTAELDRTEKDKMLRDLGFVLRGIGDPQAAPAPSAPYLAWLIRLDRTAGFSSLATRSLGNSCASTIASTGEIRGKPPRAKSCISPMDAPSTRSCPRWRSLLAESAGGGNSAS